jgi:hypothetical protein
MEVHASYFIDHFTNHPEFPLSGIITKNAKGENCLLNGKDKLPRNINDLLYLSPSFVFFNSGRWIEELQLIRKLLPTAIFLYRTGGNEIIKAPLSHNQIPPDKPTGHQLSMRQ